MGEIDRQAIDSPPARVLVALGDTVSFSHVRDLLSRNGYDVATAPDGIQALRLLESDNSPELAVLDGTIPGLNGIEICRHLRATKRGHCTYIILLTAWSEQNLRIEGLEAGADDCLYKPVDVRELRMRLQIGSRILLERALRESEQRFRDAHAETELFLQFIPSVLIGLDREGRIIRWNSAAAEVTGLSEVQVRGQTLAECGVQ